MLKIENGITAVKFGAEWCGPCKIINAQLDKMKEEFNTITFISVDVDDDPEIAKKYKISSLPTVILFKDGEIVDKLIGAVKTEPMRKKFKDISNAA
jgi:thioredoxin 1